MNRITLALWLAALPLAVRADFVFPVPAGWFDLSPSAPAENFERVPPEILQAARSGQLQAFAFDLAHTEGGFTPNLNAVVMDGPVRVTEEQKDELARQLFGPIHKMMPSAALVEAGTLEVDGVRSLRIVYDSREGASALRQMAVLVPGVPKSAVVTYSALRSQFETLRPAFEAHAASIRGAQEADALSVLSSRRGLVGAVVGGVVGFLVAAALILRRRARAASAGAPGPR